MDVFYNKHNANVEDILEAAVRKNSYLCSKMIDAYGMPYF
jgi:hypothetical protein